MPKELTNMEELKILVDRKEPLVCAYQNPDYTIRLVFESYTILMQNNPKRDYQLGERCKEKEVENLQVNIADKGKPTKKMGKDPKAKK